MKNNLEQLRKIRASIENVRSIKEKTHENLEAMGDEFDECFELEDQITSLEGIVDDLDSAIDELELVIEA